MKGEEKEVKKKKSKTESGIFRQVMFLAIQYNTIQYPTIERNMLAMREREDEQATNREFRN